MRQNQKSSSIKQTQRGVTLVELMIAMVISLIVLMGVVTVYISSKRTYNYQSVMSELQENARYAFQQITTDVRQSGFAGCNPAVTSYLAGGGGTTDLQSGVGGWEYTLAPTAPGDPYTITSVSVTGLPAEWTGPIPLPAGIAGQAIQGNDILEVSIGALAAGSPIPVNPQAVASSVVFDRPHNLEAGQIVIVTDCKEGNLFQNAAGGGGAVGATCPAAGTPGNIPAAGCNDGVTDEYKLYVVNNFMYFIGVNPAGEPALFRSDPTGAVVNELVEGVENMQVLFGEDMTDDTNFQPDQYVTADNITNPNNVMSLRISLLLRTTQNLQRDTVINNFDLLSSDPASSVNITSLDDSRVRRVFTTTIFLRNKAISRQ